MGLNGWKVIEFVFRQVEFFETCEILEEVFRKFNQMVAVETEPPQVVDVMLDEDVAGDELDVIVLHLQDGQGLPARIEDEFFVDVSNRSVPDWDADGPRFDPASAIGGVDDGLHDGALQLREPLLAVKFSTIDLFRSTKGFSNFILDQGIVQPSKCNPWSVTFPYFSGLHQT